MNAMNVCYLSFFPWFPDTTPEVCSYALFLAQDKSSYKQAKISEEIMCKTLKWAEKDYFFLYQT